MFFSPSYRKKKYHFLKKQETWWIVFIVDLFSIPGTLIFRKSRISLTPNGISLASFIIFYLSITFMYINPDKNIYYTIGFFISLVFDAIDGKLARIIKKNSDFGAIVDAFFDLLKHGLGLPLIGLILSLKNNNVFPCLIILPFSFYIGYVHIKCIKRMMYDNSLKKKLENIKRTKWQIFCEKRGLKYTIYSNVEIIYVSILLIGINLKNPNLFLFLSIYLSFIPIIWRKIRIITKKNGNNFSS